MSNPPTDDESSALEIGRAVRFGFAATIIGLSYPNIQLALRIHSFGQVFSDMLGNKPLPAITILVLHSQAILVAFSILLPLLAVAHLFIKRLAHSIYISGCLILLVFLQLFFTWHAVSAPLLSIIENMSADPASEPGLRGSP